ncbi:DUF3541 domain-containing protein [Vibrio sp. JPW-9-11-11]|uniref:DUF3541 domain-containing protein n=1 Tax=Vibrio sp. JPW-9-11-11 TaxID=1416532 RepID=UPI0015938720|nr:DUF3541 domain-containing protein [Vibrio sp. JPW-9-11-11]NVD08495.1 DUF3541 domain-containing protein [Vibrio sp. JPW-9-11-11]
MRRLLLGLCLGAVVHYSAFANNQPSTYQDSADLIRNTYESQLYTLPAFKEGHYGLRMYRQTRDEKYAAAVWTDMARVTSRLNRFSADVHTPEQILIYAEKRLSGYADETDERSLRRYSVTKHMPEYLYLGVDLLGSMARANEYGLKHKDDQKLRSVIRRYDFSRYATNPDMIKAWAAQLANQVFWLRQLGEQDIVEPFIKAFRETYPDEQDKALSKQQYGNKIYGLTHIVFADSEYYQHQVSEQQYQWIYDYFRTNIDTILLRAKEDVIAEVGISFLLAGLDDDPVVDKTRQAIQASINRDKGMIPWVSGDFDLKYGEHRNVLAIMLLDWQQVNHAPTVASDPSVFSNLPYGLVPIQHHRDK